jgi:hypothetical protein
MEKSKVFIASSGRTLVLAEKLRDRLCEDFCEPTLWSEEGRRETGQTIIEMLEGAAARHDFAVIILAKDDMMTRGERETMRARDNCVFEAGLFISAVGLNRCFLVNSVGKSDLPSDLGGIVSIPFEEPVDLTDRSACAEAIASVAAQLKDAIQKEGPCPYHARVPLLSVDEVFKREGSLTPGQVVVCDTQPWAEIERMAVVRRNMDAGIRYHGFFYSCDDTVEKICQALQMIVLAGGGGGGGGRQAENVNKNHQPSSAVSRVETIKSEKDRILNDLRFLRDESLLRISLMVDSPIYRFRVHNASEETLARFYANYYNKGFALWAEGQDATNLWRTLPKYLEEDTGDRLFVPLKDTAFDDEKRAQLGNTLSRALNKYFPGMVEEIKQICLGSASGE